MNKPIVTAEETKSSRKFTICFWRGWQCLFLPLEQNPGESSGGGGRHVPLVGDGHLDVLLAPTYTTVSSSSAITSHPVIVHCQDPASWSEAADHGPSHHDHVTVFTNWVFCLWPPRPSPPPLLWAVTSLRLRVWPARSVEADQQQAR